MSNGMFGMDSVRQTLLFFPHAQAGDYSEALLFSRSLNGPHDKAVLISDMQETHQVYGSGSAEYPLALTLHGMFNNGAPPVWAFSSRVPDLFCAVRKAIEDGQYPYSKDLEELFYAMNLAAMQYMPIPYIPEADDYPSIFARASKNPHNRSTRFTVLPDPGFIGYSKDPRGAPGPRGSTAPKQSKDFRNVGKSHNAKKRW